MTLHKIVLTGGPCAGKSTAKRWIEKEFTQKGYLVVFVPETVTQLYEMGIGISNFENNYDFQKTVLTLQLNKEIEFEIAAKNTSSDKVLLVCDRGTMDGKAFITETDFNKIIKELKKNEISLRDGYDAVFHLVTAAKGALDFYNTINNSARTETPMEAIEIDDKIISAWTGHPHFRVIDNSADFDDKMRKLIKEISTFLGEPTPYEIEKKFLIKKPSIQWLESLKECKKIEILQTYLVSDEPSIERRVRQRGEGRHFTFTLTTKEKINGLKRIEQEENITEKDYISLLMDADIKLHPIRKTRYCLMYNYQYLEIDIYPDWNNQAILEVELNNENQSIQLPPEIEIIKEVTYDDNYKNSSLAKKY